MVFVVLQVVWRADEWKSQKFGFIKRKVFCSENRTGWLEGRDEWSRIQKKEISGKMFCCTMRQRLWGDE